MCCPTLGRPHTIHVQSPIHYHDYRLIDRGMGPVGMKHWMNCATPGMSSAASGRPPRPQTPRRAHSHPQPQSALPENKQIIIKSSSSTHPSFNSYMDAFTFQQRLTFHMCTCAETSMYVWLLRLRMSPCLIIARAHIFYSIQVASFHRNAYFNRYTYLTK